MKFLLILLCLITSTAFGQTNSNYGLIDPKPSEEDKVSAKEMQHSLELFHRRITGHLNGKSLQMPYSDLERYLKRNKRTISTRRLTLVNHDETTFPELIQVINVLSSLGMKNYRLVSAAKDSKTAR